jgi:protein lysine acetyltransferase
MSNTFLIAGLDQAGDTSRPKAEQATGWPYPLLGQASGPPVKLRGERLFSAETRYKRFFGAVHITAPLARYLAEVDYVDHFAWVAVDSSDVPMGGATYVRSASDRALADISFLIEDEFQGRGLGTLLMGAVAVAARRNGISGFCADVLAENAPMRAIFARAGVTWQPAQAGVVHGYAAVPRSRPVRHHARHGGGTGRRRGRDEDPAVVLARLRPAKCGKLRRTEGGHCVPCCRPG